MTREQILWGLALNLVVLVAGAVLGPPLKRMWQLLNRPAPLSPRDKGKLAEQIAMTEQALERLRQFRDHPNDIIIYFFQLGAAALLFAVLAVSAYAWMPTASQLAAICLSTISVMFCVISLVEGNRLSEEKISAGIERLEKSIAADKVKLNASGVNDVSSTP